jgi:hypothetical protein
MQTLKITIELDIEHRDDITPAEIAEDLTREFYTLSLQEQPPYRSIHGGSWWTRASGVLVADDEPADECEGAPES